MTKILVKLENNISDNTFNNINDMKSYGLLKYIDSFPFNYTINIEEFKLRFNMDFNQIKEILDSLEKKGVISLKLKSEDDIVICIRDKYESQHIESTNIFTQNKFDLQKSDFENIIQLSSVPTFNEEKFKLHLQNYVINTSSELKNYVIDNEEQYENFLSEVRPQDFIKNTVGLKLSNVHFDFLYKMFYEYNFSKKLINLAIDYTISTNVYKTFNVKYATMLLHNWHQNNIKDYESALNYIKESKEILARKANEVSYVEPNYNEEYSSNVEVDNALEMLEKAYNE